MIVLTPERPEDQEHDDRAAMPIARIFRPLPLSTYSRYPPISDYVRRSAIDLGKHAGGNGKVEETILGLEGPSERARPG
jgi:hypothetical protein